MTDDRLKKIQSDYYDYQKKCRVGMYVTLAGIAFLFAKIFGIISDSEYIIGIVIGGGGLYWGMNFDKFSAIKNELNRLCMDRYGKPYINSMREVADDIYKK